METQEKIVMDNAGLESRYVDLETGKRVYLRIKNWRTVEEPKKEGGVINKFKADVYGLGTIPSVYENFTPPRTFSNAHVNFRKKANELLADKDRTKEVVLSVKRLDDNKPVNYDVELA